ncbi:MAG: hypothetical protein IID35_05060 [Planctomycetes bacterium]|nr:hypothetical protein [Planctomycetota bacterium]
MRRSTLPLAAALVACSAVAQPVHAATILYVDAGATGPTHDGVSWCSAFTNPQDALAVASFGDEIRVANGTYKPDQGAGQTAGDRTASFYLVSGVALRGGYAGCGAADPNVRNFATFETILSGDLSGDDAPDFTNYAENSYHVVANDDESTSAATTVLDGFTVSHGYADGPNFGASPDSKDQGSGVNIYYGPITVTNCTVRDNWSANHGSVNDHAGAVITNCELRDNASGGWAGGLFNAPGIVTIVENTSFTDNHTVGALGGGGGAAVGGDSFFTDCTFSGNSSDMHGGGIYIHNGATPTITRCTLSGNSAFNRGGGLYTLESRPIVLQTHFLENSANISETFVGGGGMYMERSDAFISDCTFTANQVIGPSGRGAGIYNNFSSPIVRNTIFSYNIASRGGGMYVQSGTFRLFNCMMYGNEVGDTGGGMYIVNAANAELVNCAIFANHGGNAAGGVYNYGSQGTTTLINCTVFRNTAGSSDRAGILNAAGRHTNIYNSILWGNGRLDESAQIFLALSFNGVVPDATADIQNSLVHGWTGVLGGVGNSGADPMFVNPDGGDGQPGTADDDMRVASGSPAINAGNNTLIPQDLADLDDDGNTTEIVPLDLYGSRRIASGVVDVGAAEFGSLTSPPCPPGTFSEDGEEPCTACSPGTFQPSDGQVTCIPCLPGTVQPNNGQTACTACDPGTFAAQPGSTTCSPCAVGTYQPLSGADQCFSCEGESNPVAGEGEDDCNDNTLPDTCEVLANDCNGNFVLDACEIASGDSFDCDENGIPDECEADCQPNGRVDSCDILEGFSTDLDLNGVPDECVYVPPPNPLADPVGINNNRYISFSVPAGGPTWDARTAIRVTFRSLHHPDPDNIAEYPARDFSSFEGQVRWVGPPRSFDENEYTDATFIASSLQCEPYYTDWSSVDLLNVTGAGIVPSSIYDVQVVAASCDGFEDICTAKSETLTIETARWGDLVAPFQEPGGPPGTASQPDVRDLAAVVTVLVLPVPSVPFVRAKLQGSRPDSATKINVLEITFVTDAVKSLNYPFAGPTDCP